MMLRSLESWLSIRQQGLVGKFHYGYNLFLWQMLTQVGGLGAPAGSGGLGRQCQSLIAAPTKLPAARNGDVGPPMVLAPAFFHLLSGWPKKLFLYH